MTLAAMESNPISLDAPPTVVMPPLRVLIVDDHAQTLAAVASILKHEYPMIDVIGVADDGETAVRIARESVPDVVVLDLDLGREYGLDLMPAIGGGRPELAFVIFTSADNPSERSRARAAGAAAFVSKLAPAQDLVAAILATRTNAVGQEFCHRTGG
jgi:DNA-binding NarL/FixJ family response regulator